MLIFRGVVKGIKTLNLVSRNNEAYQKTLLGIANPKPNGYEGEEIIKEFELSKTQINSGIVTEYNNLIGKKVEIQVWYQASGDARQGHKAVYETWRLSGDGRPLSVEGKQLKSVA